MNIKCCVISLNIGIYNFILLKSLEKLTLIYNPSLRIYNLKLGL